VRPRRPNLPSRRNAGRRTAAQRLLMLMTRGRSNGRGSCRRPSGAASAACRCSRRSATVSTPRRCGRQKSVTCPDGSPGQHVGYVASAPIERRCHRNAVRNSLQAPSTDRRRYSISHCRTVRDNPSTARIAVTSVVAISLYRVIACPSSIVPICLPRPRALARWGFEDLPTFMRSARPASTMSACVRPPGAA